MRWLYLLVSFWLVVLGVGIVLMLAQSKALVEPRLGVSFTPSQATFLGLDWRQVYLDILDDLGVKYLRLQANWNDIELEPDRFDFTDLDWQLQQATARGAQVTLAVGRKLPRWPECQEPAWTTTLEPWEVEERVLIMLRATVEHVRGWSVIDRWQLENEPLFFFGNCPKPSWHFLKKELSLLKSLDSRPVMLTDSGELSSWWETATLVDIQGVTLYQVTWNPTFGYWYYPLPAWYYRFKAALISPLVERTVVSELQMEPWGPTSLELMTLEQARESLDVARFRNNVAFFRRTGLSEAYLWGVEWWYKARELGDDSLWQEAKQLFQSQKTDAAINYFFVIR